MTDARETEPAIELAERIKQNCDRYWELCILGKDEEGTHLYREGIVPEMNVLEKVYSDLSDKDKMTVDQKLREAYGHLTEATCVMNGQIKRLKRRLEQ